MDLSTRLTAALASLTAALDTLETAARRRTVSAGASFEDLAQLRQENHRLRVATERGEGRLQTLLAANDDVRDRLGRVAQALRGGASAEPPPSDRPS